MSIRTFSFTPSVRLRRIVLWGSLFCAGVLCLLCLCLLVGLAPVRPFVKKEHMFTVQSGVGARKVIHELRNARLIRSEWAARLYVFARALNFKAGSYAVSPAMSAVRILTMLDDVEQQRFIKVTVPEGLTVKKIAALLQDATVVSAAAFVEACTSAALRTRYKIPAPSVEGFLYPDTYFFSYQERAANVVGTMIENFLAKTSQLPSFPGDPVARFKTVILASIVEREYRVASEAARIAGVFYNRMKVNMGLQSCATVEYVITEIEGKAHPERLFFKDLEIDSPFNTYKCAGLPPAPISNPGLTALNAALHPEVHDFFYFRLTDPQAGTHTFTKTLDEHDQAGLMLLKKNTGM
ncbi:endolytic transglycosylase MltG [Treponema pallidum]|uniref:Endolytic murein transglycosylase n=2 Tax=Treponema pallidum TaxID=160 RepID=A0AAU8PIK7_TREPG|nr:endolytic transglycosylase MltG [Treponema pallidum]AEZ57613.1 hypothetical protein TPESAMD_0491 [Treponema pallidum subsp. pertenue str. SamoaD]AEZ59750.1 hypothetical protein TPEGAU_0491 [Treponema pallidum subsp. pertenue str. Gauthier]AEZ60813.1 hypothetical protein TPADAL_0491 [Treponema pallidum subsp. pallidum DAL-1]AFU66492.1 hypothetical protein TPAMA_0491 [Treponema pallidum subsp. pallidum str. Mexico A]AGK84135.1 hypothetical protein TPFB_0491 [Treponema pallidum str. Fribourg-B